MRKTRLRFALRQCKVPSARRLLWIGQNSPVGPQELRLRLAAILAADAVGYSRLMSADDRGTVKALDAARETFQTISVANGGRVVDTAGDSVLAIFKTAAGATAAAIAIQHEVETCANAVPEDRRLRFRLGLHLGDVMQKPDGSVYGDGVNVAARLQSIAPAGGIVASESIRLAVRGKVAACFEDLGDQSLKNIAEPVRAHRVSATGFGPNVQGRGRWWRRPLRKRVVFMLAAVAALAVSLAGFLVLRKSPAYPNEANSAVSQRAAAYSAGDLRMTFAVLPVQVPAGDAEASALAPAVYDAVQAGQEARYLWARVAQRSARQTPQWVHGAPDRRR